MIYWFSRFHLFEAESAGLLHIVVVQVLRSHNQPRFRLSTIALDTYLGNHRGSERWLAPIEHRRLIVLLGLRYMNDRLLRAQEPRWPLVGFACKAWRSLGEGSWIDSDEVIQ